MNPMCQVDWIDENMHWMDWVCVKLNWKLIEDAKNIDRNGGWPGDHFYLQWNQFHYNRGEKPHELDEYPAVPVEKVKDPLEWWCNHQKVYPALSLMAFDYLSAPSKSNSQ